MENPLQHFVSYKQADWAVFFHGLSSPLIIIHKSPVVFSNFASCTGKIPLPDSIQLEVPAANPMVLAFLRIWQDTNISLHTAISHFKPKQSKQEAQASLSVSSRRRSSAPLQAYPFKDSLLQTGSWVLGSKCSPEAGYPGMLVIISIFLDIQFLSCSSP